MESVGGLADATPTVYKTNMGYNFSLIHNHLIEYIMNTTCHNHEPVGL